MFAIKILKIECDLMQDNKKSIKENKVIELIEHKFAKFFYKDKVS